jgi:hypothetical protein
VLRRSYVIEYQVMNPSCGPGGATRMNTESPGDWQRPSSVPGRRQTLRNWPFESGSTNVTMLSFTTPPLQT